MKKMNYEELKSLYHNGKKDFSDLDFEGWLSNEEFSRVDFSRSSFAQPDPGDSSIEEVDFNGSNLFEANFSKVVFESVSFEKTNLEKANFKEAVFACVEFYGANLQGAQFQGSIAEEAQFGKTNLSNADLSDADFEGAFYLSEATLSGAKYNSNTVFPEDFDPESHGMVKKEE